MELKGEINEYTCRSCGSVTHTINLSHGTTPFGVRCPQCGVNECMSNFYRLTKKPLVTHAFYRPKALPADAGMKEYVKNGCLSFDVLDKAVAEMLTNDPIMPDTSKEMFDLMIQEVYNQWLGS